MMMLHLWIAKAGHVQVSDVEHALKRIGREDIVNRCIHGNLADDSAAQLANGYKQQYSLLYSFCHIYLFHLFM